MERSFEIDFNDWEVIPTSHHAVIDLGGLGSEKSLLFSKDIDVDYFSDSKDSSLMIEEKEECKDIGVVLDDRDVTSMVLFKKLKDDKFVDMKIESPKSNMIRDTIMPPSDQSEYVEEEEEEEEEEFYEDEKKSEKEFEYVEPETKEKKFGITIWRWRVMGGVGALCSIGMAAATLCIIILGGRQSQKQQHQNQKIQFQIYTDEKRIKEVVHQATRLNQAFSTARGVPINRAHISFGGYYDGI